MTTWVYEQGRMLKSARALKAYFEHKLHTSFELLTAPPAHVGAGDVAFGEAMNHYGLWGIRAAKALQDEDQTEILTTFQSILGGLELMAQRRDELNHLATRLDESVSPSAQLPANVIPLRRPSETRPSATNDRRWILKIDCLIESRYISEIHKMAMELHSHSQRYAFVEYRDLDPAQRTNLTELLSLGGITLFIPEMMTLTMPEQETLKDLMKVETVQRPLLMVGVTLPYSELRSVAGVHVEFLSLLSRAYIKLSKPFIEYKEQGLIHYFLDCMAENPS